MHLLPCHDAKPVGISRSIERLPFSHDLVMRLGQEPKIHMRNNDGNSVAVFLHLRIRPRKNLFRCVAVEMKHHKLQAFRLKELAAVGIVPRLGNIPRVLFVS